MGDHLIFDPEEKVGAPMNNAMDKGQAKTWIPREHQRGGADLVDSR